MFMLTEDYCDFETAELLKEKGMNKYCFKHYVQKNNNDGTSEAVTVCTLQMAMKWLREAHGLNVKVCIVRTIELKKAYNATIYNNNCEQIKSHFGKNILDGFISYEEACEAAINYCLEFLI